MKTPRKSARNKNYWIEKGYDEKTAITMARSRMPGTKEYFLYYKKTAPTEAEAQRMMDEWFSLKACTIENFTRKYGKEEGVRRFEVYCDKQAYSNTLEYMVKKYGVEKGTEKYYKANRDRAITIENCTEKYGDVEGTRIWNEYVKKQRVNGKTKDYFIEKYGKEEGEKKYDEIGKRKSQSFNGFLLRANGNIEEATKKHNEYIKTVWETRIKTRGVSLSSQKLFDLLRDKLIELGYENFYYATHNCEWGFNIVNKNRFVYLDFFLKDTGKVIEYNGDYFHANPKKHKADDIIYIYGTPTKADIIWKNDSERISDIKTIPYIKDVLTIWEDDVRLYPKETIEKCIKYLLE